MRDATESTDPLVAAIAGMPEVVANLLRDHRPPMSSAEIERGVYGVWRRLSARGPIEVGALDETERQWAALLVRHRLAAVRSRHLTQLSRAADMSNWEALSGRGLYAPRGRSSVTRDPAPAEER